MGNTVYLAIAQTALTAQTPLDIPNPSPIEAEEGEEAGRRMKTGRGGSRTGHFRIKIKNHYNIVPTS